jgi:TrpR family trp operon transcriptional repressor
VVEEFPGLQRLCALLARADSATEVKELLELFLTITEREAIGGRYLIVEGLMEGKKTQRELAEDLGLSISKITAGSNAIKRAEPTLRRLVEQKMAEVRKDG